MGGSRLGCLAGHGVRPSPAQGDTDAEELKRASQKTCSGPEPPADSRLGLPHIIERMTRTTATAIAADAHLDESARAVRVLLQFRQIFNAVKTHFQHVESSVGLGGAQLWALGVIRDTPGIGTGGVAERLNIHQSTASNLLSALVERKLIAGKKDEGDKRAVRWRLLPAGTAVLKRSPGPFTGVLPQALHELDEKVLERLEKDLKQLLKALGGPDRKAARTPLDGMLSPARQKPDSRAATSSSSAAAPASPPASPRPARRPARSSR